jgi:hypothetical protein
MSLSVCLLSRNEEEHIGRALRSVAGVADEVVVADAGSRDRTPRIATELGARVLPFGWDDDLAAGRNFLAGQARGKWVLWLNADEELHEASHSAVRECLLRGDVFGYSVHVQQPIEGERFTELAEVRLFRLRPDLRFAGRLHPEVPEELVQKVALEGQHVTGSSIVLRSAVMAHQRNEARLRWTCRLLEFELAHRPSELGHLVEYGCTLLALHDPRGHAVLAEAAKQVASARNAVGAHSPKVQLLLEYLLTVSPAVSQSRLTRDDAFELVLRWFPSSPVVLYKCAETAFQRGDFSAAKQILERLLELGRTGAVDCSRRFDPATLGEDALINLAACCERLGDRDQAELYYRPLLASRHSAPAAAGLKRLRRSPRS